MGTNEELKDVRGPLLSDERLFERLREDLPDLAEIKALFAEGKAEAAKHALAEYVRKNLDTDTYFSMPGKNRHPEFTDQLRERAERALRHEMSSCGTPFKFEGEVDWYSNPTFNEYREWTWQLSRHVELDALARAYNATSDDKYAEGAAELLSSWLRQAKAPTDDVHSHATKCWRTIECGIRLLGVWPFIINSLIKTAAFTDGLIIDIIKSLYEHQHRICLHYTHANWLVMELTGMINICAMLPIFKESPIWLDSAVALFEREMAGQIHPEGFQYELSTDYHGVVLGNLRIVLEILEAYKVGSTEGLRGVLTNMIDLYSKLLMSGCQIPDLNDGRHGHVDIFIRGYLRYCEDTPWVKWARSDGKEGEPPEFLSNHLPCAGMVCFRESWDKNAVTALFDGGKFGSNHQHEDKLSLVIYKDGAPILLEGNKYAYDTSPMRSYVLSSRAHNVTLLDGKGQNRRAYYKWDPATLTREEPMTVALDRDVEIAVSSYGDLPGEVWGSEPYPKARQERLVAFVRKPHTGSPFFIVRDEFSAAEEHVFTSMWHVGDEDMKIGGAIATSDRMKIFVLGDIDGMSVIKGQEEPVFQGFSARSAIQLDYYAVPTLTVDSKGKRAHTLTLLCPDGKDCRITGVTWDGDEVTVKYSDGFTDCISLKP